MVPGGATVDNQSAGSDPNGPEFTIAWVPKVLVLREKGPDVSDLVNIAQVFQRSGTREVSWAPGHGPEPTVDQSITKPEDFKGKKIGVWDFGNDYEIIAAARKVGLEAGTRLRAGHPAVRHVAAAEPADRRRRGHDLQRVRPGARGDEPRHGRPLPA